MPDLYMPDVQVEIAFDSGYTTPAASRTWTDVSDYVELEDRIAIGFGRSDERSTADANTLSLTLDNSDGRFTAKRAASPYYPNVKIGRPIRVRVTPNANLHPNGGLEVDATGWTSNTVFGTWGTATMARSTTRAHEGSASLLVTWPTHATASYANVNLPAAQLRVGETYTASCWVWVPAGSPDPRIEVVFQTASARTSLKDQWVYLEHTFTATSTNRQVGVQVLTPTAGQQCYVDEFMVNRGATALPYTSEVAETSTRFVGFVDDWPVEWDGSDAYARAPITAASRMSRLGLGAKLRSTIEQTILATGPARYWTLGDPSSATSASESSGNGGDPLVPTGTGTAVAFGNATGPASDGLTAAEFSGTWTTNTATFPTWTGQWLRAPLNDFPGPLRAVRFTLNTTSTPTGTDSDNKAPIANFNDDATPEIITFTRDVTLTEDGKALVVSGLVTSASSVADGQTHDIVATFPSGSAVNRLYVDGVDQGGGIDLIDATPTAFGFGQGLTGTMSHVALYTTELTAAEIAEQADAIATGFAGDRTDERIVRALEWAGVPSSEITVETGVETMTYQLTGGMSVIDVLRECESTEGGVLFDGRDGNVTFHNRSHRYTLTPAVTLDMSSQHVGTDYAPRVDRSTLVNDVEVENPTTGEKVRVVDTDSSDEYGVATDTVTVVAESIAGFRERADWVLASYAEPATRAPSLTVDVLAHQGLTPSAQELLELTMGDLIEVDNAPAQSDTSTPAYFVEGYVEVIGPESYDVTFNLSPSSPTTDVLILDSAARGLLDTNVLGY